MSSYLCLHTTLLMLQREIVVIQTRTLGYVVKLSNTHTNRIAGLHPTIVGINSVHVQFDEYFALCLFALEPDDVITSYL